MVKKGQTEVGRNEGLGNYGGRGLMEGEREVGGKKGRAEGARAGGREVGREGGGKRRDREMEVAR